MVRAILAAAAALPLAALPPAAPLARAWLRGLDDDAANASITARAKADVHPGTAMREPEFAYVDSTGRLEWHHVR